MLCKKELLVIRGPKDYLKFAHLKDYFVTQAALYQNEHNSKKKKKRKKYSWYFKSLNKLHWRVVFVYISISALSIGKLFLDPHNHIYNYSGPLNNVGVMEADPHPLKTPQYNFQLHRHLLVAQFLQGGGSRMHPPSLQAPRHKDTAVLM